MNIVKTIRDKVQAKRDQKKAVQNIIKSTLESHGWKVLERDIKDRLRDTYKTLLKVTPKELERKQMEIRVSLDFIENLYFKAGLEWDYDGYSEIKEPKIENGELAKEEQLFNEHLRRITEEEDA